FSGHSQRRQFRAVRLFRRRAGDLAALPGCGHSHPRRRHQRIPACHHRIAGGERRTAGRERTSCRHRTGPTPTGRSVMTRRARVERTTRESTITVELDLDGTGTVDIDTGVPFYDHMLTALGSHASFDLTVRAKGD